MKTTRKVLAVAACALFAAGSVLYLGCSDYSHYFKSKKGNLASVQLIPYRSDPTFDYHRLSLASDSGLKVVSNLLTPAKEERSHRYPAVVLLGGLGTGRQAVDYVTDISQLIIAAPDYPYREEDLGTAFKFMAQLPALRRAALDTVPSVMLLVDYLAGREDVDPGRIILVGYSLGAPFVPCMAVEDRRPAAAVMVFGGGDLRCMLKKKISSFAGGEIQGALLSTLGGFLLRPIEPNRYADRISPIPLLMINGTNDDVIPRQCTEKFFERARNPKKLVWLEARHVSPKNRELTRQIVAILKQELAVLGILTAGEEPSRRGRPPSGGSSSARSAIGNDFPSRDSVRDKINYGRW